MIGQREPLVAHCRTGDGTQLNHPAHGTIIRPLDIPVTAGPSIHAIQFTDELQHTLQPLRPRWQQDVRRLATAAARNIKRLPGHLAGQQVLGRAVHDVDQIVLVFALRERHTSVFRVHESHHNQVATHRDAFARRTHAPRRISDRRRIASGHTQHTQKRAGMTLAT